MIARMLVAAVGATIITAALLLGMRGFVQVFRNHDSGRYFYISDILPRPERGRPERPSDVVRAPARRTPEYAGDSGAVTLSAPAEPEIETPSAVAPRPSLGDAEPDRSP